MAMRIARIDFRVQVTMGGDLAGLRQRLRHHPVTAAAVAQDNFDLGMIGDPRLHGRNLAVGQERQGSPPLKIIHDRSVAMISTPRPMVDAGHIQLVIRQIRSQPHDPHNSVSLLTGTIGRSRSPGNGRFGLREIRCCAPSHHHFKLANRVRQFTASVVINCNRALKRRHGSLNAIYPLTNAA